MASIKKTSSNTYQLTVRNKLLPKAFYATFDSEDEARQYGKMIDGLLAQGIVPAGLLVEHAKPTTSWSIARCVAEYVRNNTVPVSEIKLLDTILPLMLGVTTAHLSYEWAECWVSTMKREQNLAPSTIRHRHGALARCLDWVIRKHPEIMAQNPLRLLKRGFATYSPDDARTVVQRGGRVKENVERDRRLDHDEESRILAKLKDFPDETAFFILALETAMRMRECYTLNIDQVNFARRTIHLERSKNGYNRQVPLSSTALTLLQDYMSAHSVAIQNRDGRLFPFWSGDKSTDALDGTTAYLSAVFAGVFRRADVVDFRFHDLRHEATCRLFLKTDLSDTLIAKTTGHRDPRMLKRYASLRGSDLAARLW